MPFVSVDNQERRKSHIRKFRDRADRLRLDILANGTVTPAVVLIGAATITPVWRYSDGTSFSGLDGFSGGGKVVAAGMWLELDLEGSPEQIKELNLTDDPFGFDLSALARFTGLTHIRLHNNFDARYTGTFADLPASTQNFIAYKTDSNITGYVTDLVDVRYFQIFLTSCVIVGTVSQLPPNMVEFFIQGTGSVLTGTLSDAPGNLRRLHVEATASLITGGATPVVCTGIITVRLHDTGMIEAEVDDVCSRLYDDRLSFTNAAPALNIGGTNADPSGLYQDATPPTTGLEFVFKLENDPDGDGFNVWTITY